MSIANNTSRALGAALLLQAVTPLLNGLFLLQPLVVPGSIMTTMNNIASHAVQWQAYIFGEIITALGIAFLGSLLFIHLRKQNEKVALVALGFYWIEAALLAVSKIAAFMLLRASQEYTAAPDTAGLLTLGRLAMDAMDFGYTLHMLIFCMGAILFYSLLYQSAFMPRALSLWGLIAIFPCLIATLVGFFGYEAPFILYVPYVPFEFVVGAWILIRGIPEGSAVTFQMAPAKA